MGKKPEAAAVKERHHVVFAVWFKLAPANDYKSLKFLLIYAKFYVYSVSKSITFLGYRDLNCWGNQAILITKNTSEGDLLAFAWVRLKQRYCIYSTQLYV